jgi:delta24-sterol reductase
MELLSTVWRFGQHLALAAAIVTAIRLLTRHRHRQSLYTTERNHQHRLYTILASLRSLPPDAKLSLHRRTLQSNTIRNSAHKSLPTYFPVDLSSFCHILHVDRIGLSVTCEPGIPFGVLLAELLKVGMTTLVVPELPGITVGGAIAGGGLESSSHRYGQVSDTVLEIQCLTPEPRTCSPTVNPDLFYAISASYNTVALMTRVTLRIGPAPKYVSLQAEVCADYKGAVTEIQDARGADTIEGIAYSPTEILVIRGTHTNTASSPVRRFTRHWDRWYYKSIRDTRAMTVPYTDYCFRYNYGSFWMANYVLDMLGGDHLLTRAVIGGFLDTKHLFAVLHSSNLTDLGRMRVIQDCYVPAERAVEFLEAQDNEIGVYPLWLCPIKATQTKQVLASHYGSEGAYVNVGIYGRPRQFPFNPQEIHSRLIDLLIQYGGRSMLYAQNWHTPAQFGEMYGAAVMEVEGVSERHGAKGNFFGLYEKVALSEEDRAALGRPVEGTEVQAMKQVVWDIVRQKLGQGHTRSS